MSIEETNKALIVRYYEFLNSKELSLEEFVDPKFVFRDPAQPDVTDFASVRQWLAAAYDAFPDAHFSIDDLIAEGDKVVCRNTSRMTHQREFMGIPPTGKELTLTGISIYRIVGDKIREEWNLADTQGLMRQLGVVP